MRNYLSRKNDTFGLGFFDDMFGDFFAPSFFRGGKSAMSTDLKELDTGYELSVDMPGFEKKDIELSLEGGYLTVSAKREEKEEEKNNYLRRERSFSCSRSYYVGDLVTEEDIKAKYDKGILTLIVPKKEKEIEKKRQIEIE